MLALVRSVAIAITMVVGLGVAAAQPEGEVGGTDGTGIGVGAEAMLPAVFDVGGAGVSVVGVGGVSVVYDAGPFHCGGIFGFQDDDNATDLAIGGRFLYHLHEAAAADFSIGGGVGMRHVFRDNNPDEDDFMLEALVQLRAFIVPNVAISGSAGVAVTSGDHDRFVITGQPLGSVGITYFFF